MEGGCPRASCFIISLLSAGLKSELQKRNYRGEMIRIGNLSLQKGLNGTLNMGKRMIILINCVNKKL